MNQTALNSNVESTLSRTKQLTNWKNNESNNIIPLLDLYENQIPRSRNIQKRSAVYGYHDCAGKQNVLSRAVQFDSSVRLSIFLTLLMMKWQCWFWAARCTTFCLEKFALQTLAMLMLSKAESRRLCACLWQKGLANGQKAVGLVIMVYS